MNENEVSRNVTGRLSPAELRLGNFFKYKGEGTLEGYIQKVQTEHLEFLENPEMRHEMIEPIPLDEQWLLKFGFSYHKGGPWLEIALSEHLKGYLLYREGNIKAEICSKQFALVRPPMKYVHQLQNLYFALCGEELEINGL